ncbi:hypothetical protein A0H81_12610 [Grifola frondosa]|uniref:Domain of unknown function at the cortex 1 domain-containing protein n=1 Tax=Grifola frondosa TaxID=5627 RepID=A0A1C7LRK0_GRIFR|nr:hypothetical protein A0H81_12610 [Grifola frondosa]
MPRLRVLAGPSVTELVPIVANSGIPAKINSDAFEGLVAVYIKGIEGTQGKVGENEYFDQEERRGVTWSIQVQGRFLRPRSADDILFGNTFERPLTLPWGSSAALRFMSFIDPTLEHDLASSSKPWALSPLIATMPYFEHKRVKYGSPTPPFPPQKPVGDDTTQLRSSNGKGKGLS